MAYECVRPGRVRLPDSVTSEMQRLRAQVILGGSPQRPMEELAGLSALYLEARRGTAEEVQ